MSYKYLPTPANKLVIEKVISLHEHEDALLEKRAKQRGMCSSHKSASMASLEKSSLKSVHSTLSTSLPEERPVDCGSRDNQSSGQTTSMPYAPKQDRAAAESNGSKSSLSATSQTVSNASLNQGSVDSSSFDDNAKSDAASFFAASSPLQSALNSASDQYLEAAFELFAKKYGYTHTSSSDASNSVSSNGGASIGGSSNGSSSNGGTFNGYSLNDRTSHGSSANARSTNTNAYTLGSASARSSNADFAANTSTTYSSRGYASQQTSAHQGYYDASTSYAALGFHAAKDANAFDYFKAVNPANTANAANAANTARSSQAARSNYNNSLNDVAGSNNLAHGVHATNTSNAAHAANTTHGVYAANAANTGHAESDFSSAFEAFSAAKEDGFNSGSEVSNKASASYGRGISQYANTKTGAMADTHAISNQASSSSLEGRWGVNAGGNANGNSDGNAGISHGGGYNGFGGGFGSSMGSGSGSGSSSDSVFGSSYGSGHSSDSDSSSDSGSNSNHSELQALGLSEEDIAKIEAMRKLYSSSFDSSNDNAGSEESQGASFFEHLTQTPDSFAERAAIFATTPDDDQSVNELFSNQEGMLSAAPNGGANEVADAFTHFSAQDNISPRMLAASASLNPDTIDQSLLQKGPEPNQFDSQDNFVRLDKLNQRNQEIMRNELQFKADFNRQAHMPGAILYVHSERKVYINPPSATLLGIELPELQAKAGTYDPAILSSSQDATRAIATTDGVENVDTRDQANAQVNAAPNAKSAKSAKSLEKVSFSTPELRKFKGLGTDVNLQKEFLKEPDMQSLGKTSMQNVGVPYLKFLRLLGRELTHNLFYYLRLLRKAPSCLNPLRCRIDACPFGRNMKQREIRLCPYLRNVDQGFDYTLNINRSPDCVSFEIKVKPDPESSPYYLYIRSAAFYDHVGHLMSMSFSLSQQASRYFALVPNLVADNASFDWNIKNDQRKFSPNFYRILGYPVNSTDVPSHLFDWVKKMVHPNEQLRVADFLRNHEQLDNNDSYEIYYRLKRVDGNYLWCKVTGVVFARDEHGHAIRVIGAISNINHVVDSYEKIRNKIYTDVLTGLKNRAYMHSQLPFLLHPKQQPVGIIFVDATALKLYNDYLSHSTGDRLLITLTSLLNHNIPNPKYLIRLSGDEFVCLIPKCNSERLQEIEHAIIEARNQYNTKAPVRMPVFFSFGSSVLDLRESLYAHLTKILSLREDEPLPKKFMTDAKELFYLAVQASDLQMQFYKRHNKQKHYQLIKAYIENILQYSISLNDSRISMTINP